MSDENSMDDVGDVGDVGDVDVSSGKSDDIEVDDDLSSISDEEMQKKDEEIVEQANASQISEQGPEHSQVDLEALLANFPETADAKIAEDEKEEKEENENENEEEEDEDDDDDDEEEEEEETTVKSASTEKQSKKKEKAALPSFKKQQIEQLQEANENQRKTTAEPSASNESEYTAFLELEKQVMSDRPHDQWPPNTRLFLGNLPTEKVSKREIWRVFHPYGKLAEIALKQAYGFVQFYEQSDCERALKECQGASVSGRPIHLEISKSKSDNHNNKNNNNTRQQSSSQNNNNSNNNNNNNRRRSNNANNHSRSPPPRRGDNRNRNKNDYSSNDRDRRDDARRRSRSPVYRRRSRSPRRDYNDLPLPRRYSIPEVQIIVVDEGDISRDYIAYIERSFHDRDVKIEQMFLSLRISVQATVEQLVGEGVRAVIFLSRSLQSRNSVRIQLFDRLDRHSTSVRYDEYSSVDVIAAVELFVRARQSGYSGYAPAASAPPPNPMAALMSSLDPQTLQKVLGALAGGQQPQQPPPPQQYSSYNQYSPPHQSAYSSAPAPPPSTSQPSVNDALAALLASQAGPPNSNRQSSQQGQQSTSSSASGQVQSLLAQLARTSGQR